MPGHLLEAAALVADQLLELLLAIGDRLLAAAEVARALAELLVALLEQLELAVEHVLALDEPALFALDLFAASAHFALEVLAELDQLFLAGDDRALPEVLRLALGVADDSLGGFLGGRLRRDLSFDAPPCVPALRPTMKKAGRRPR